MSSQYSRNHCKISIAKILQTIGWHSINSTPLEVLTDILSKYITQISKLTNDYATEFGQTEPNIDHLGLAFQEMGINIQELDEYVRYVNFAPAPHPVPKFPIPKENNLNFLKPGSKEVVTRPVHIHEHLPPMYPLLEGSENETESVVKKEIEEENTEQFKKPDICSPEFKRPRREEEGSRPTREISSVMMTTSGFLSPAREGKLPEARTPVPPPEPVPPPPQTTPAEPVRKKVEKKREKVGKELFKPITEGKVAKKTPTMKDVFKMKQLKAAANHAINNMQPLPQQLSVQPNNDARISSVPQPKVHNSKSNFNKALAAAKAKTEKLNTTITPIPMRPEISHSQPQMHQVDKLFTEPDKKKVNIFKKISNVKEKPSRKDDFRALSHMNPHLIMDEPNDIVSKINLSSDITIEPINPVPIRNISPEKIECYFDDGTPPGTPKTPEIVTHSPPIVKEKRKRKDKSKVKKIKKQPTFLDTDVLGLTMDRPKTPEAHVVMRQHPQQLPIPPMAHTTPMQFPFPLANFGGPGLIPTPLNNPLFPFPHLPNLPNFGKNPYFPPVPMNLPPSPLNIPSSTDFIPHVSPKTKEPKIEPAEVIPQPPPQALPQSPQPHLVDDSSTLSSEASKKSKEHKKEKKDKIKKKNKKDKVKDKAEKKKLKEAKKGKDKIKKEKKEKKKEKDIIKETESPIPKILLKVNSPSPRPETPETMKKLNIKPVVRKEEIPGPSEEKKRDPSPGLAKISALVTGPPKQKTSPIIPPVEKSSPEGPTVVHTPRPPGRPRIHPIKPKPSPPKPKKVEQPFVKKDEHGNDVWICPACGQQDDGRPMIGCDGCDAWYHWVCVGIQVPPDENENWYCKPCLCRKNEDLQDKKKKRKKREKKEH